MSSSTTREPVNAGAARSSSCQSIGVRFARASRAAAAACAPSRRAARAGAPGRRGSRRRAATRRSPSSRSRDDADDARRVEHVHRRLAVLGRDPHGGVLLRGRRAADQERQLDPAPLHLLRDVHHLVERRRDEPREPDDVAVLLERGVEDPVGGDHDPEVDRPRSRCSRGRPRRCSCRCRGRRP